MLGWIVTLLILAAVAALLGYGGIATTFAGIAQILFFIFLTILLLVVITSLITGRRILR